MSRDGNELLTLREAAALCRVHVETIKKWIAAGLIPSGRVVYVGPGRRRRLRRADVRRYLMTVPSPKKNSSVRQ